VDACHAMPTRKQTMFSAGVNSLTTGWRQGRVVNSFVGLIWQGYRSGRLQQNGYDHDRPLLAHSGQSLKVRSWCKAECGDCGCGGRLLFSWRLRSPYYGTSMPPTGVHRRHLTVAFTSACQPSLSRISSYCGCEQSWPENCRSQNELTMFPDCICEIIVWA